ncbi:MAG: hypothetical protein V3V49_00240, partial [Candidatus Krumholzibacteria bacterium]
VKEECRRDRSVAIAHGLESLCEVEVLAPNRTGKKRKKSAKSEVSLRAERKASGVLSTILEETEE